ncbi:hypothetical protein CDAR_62631 [Caerostris darwini]|uniref:Uncharacterized protein n=1 Tax=Caerostris darwini TaxID=1538125 RepID=A0AAV4UF67_9ARAC|nr:hypothetical protein CDAR_62631 [Caerostris darwini]
MLSKTTRCALSSELINGWQTSSFSVSSLSKRNHPRNWGLPTRHKTDEDPDHFHLTSDCSFTPLDRKRDLKEGEQQRDP